MFKIGDKVLDRNGRIFLIECSEMKDFGNGDAPYFVLKPCFRYDFNDGYRTYVPEDRSASLLRPVMEREEALEIIDSLPSLETFPEVNPRERKNFFAKVVSSGNRTDICKVIKTLLAYRQERLRRNKQFSDFDRRLLNSLILLFTNEISVALEMEPESVLPFVKERTGLILE
ncbi:MAG: hypothetical protein SOX21_03775 [Candidatus Enterosoma sp.]|nr:hypothetical protein [Candidatus Enterosoma sp.]